MTSSAARVDLQRQPPTPVTPLLPRHHYCPFKGRSVVNSGGELILIIYSRNTPGGMTFTASVRHQGARVMMKPIEKSRWEAALLHGVAKATELGLIRLPDQSHRRIRLIDCHDRKLVVADLSDGTRFTVLGAVRDSWNIKGQRPVELWRPVADGYDSDNFVEDPGSAMLMALHWLIERGYWT